MSRLASRLRWLGLALLLVALCAFAIHQLSSTWILLGAHPEILDELERSLDEQKELAALQPDLASERRETFERRQQLLQRLRILDANRERLSRVLVAFVVGLIVLVAGAATTLHLFDRERRARRLARLKRGLEQLSEGTAPVVVEDDGGGALGEVGRMIEEVSSTVGAERRRLRELDHLSAWREGARRLGHEMRTPLTSIQLELQRLGDRVPEAGVGDAGELAAIHHRLSADFRSLQSFLDRFTASARLPAPSPRRLDLAPTVREFATAFASAWPHLELTAEIADGDGDRHRLDALADPEALRQVLVNLVANASEAIRPGPDRPARVRLRLARSAASVRLDVVDDGPGVPAELREKIFQPYFSGGPDGVAADRSRFGLGLAISRMLILQQGGSLELLPRAESPLGSGAVFRITLPAASAAE